MKLSLVCLMIVMCCSAVFAAEGYHLKYSFRPGETLKYKTLYQAESKIDTFGKITEFKTTTSMTAESKILGGSSEGFRVENTVIDANGKTNGKEVNLSTYLNKKEHYLFKPNGVYYAVVNGQVDPTAQVQLILPDEAVGVGSVWEITRELNFNVDIPEFKKYVMRFEYKFEKIENYQGIRCAVIRITGRGKQAFNESVNAQLKVAGRAYFALENGRIVETMSKMDFLVQIYGEEGGEKKQNAAFSGSEMNKLSLIK